MAAMRIVVMGSGGTGGYFGAKLARAGEDVTFVARGAHLGRAPDASGLRIKSAAEGDWVVRAPAVERLDGLPPADLVLFCVKSFDTEEAAARSSARVVGPDTGVLSIQNGVDNEEKLERDAGHRPRAGRRRSGSSPPSRRRASSAHALRRASHLRRDGRARDGAGPGFSRRLPEAPRSRPSSWTMYLRTLWDKYVFLTTHAGMTALTRCPAGVLRAVPEVRGALPALASEIIAVGRAAGVKLDDAMLEQGFKFLDTVAPNALLVAPPRPDPRQAPRAGGAPRPRGAAGERHQVPAPTVFAIYAALLPYRDGAPAAPARP